MNTTTNSLLAVNTLRLAHDFLAALNNDSAAALTHLRVSLDGMEEWEIRQWFDHLGTLLVEEECSAEVWFAMLQALESLDEILTPYLHSRSYACVPCDNR